MKYSIAIFSVVFADKPFLIEVEAFSVATCLKYITCFVFIGTTAECDDK